MTLASAMGGKLSFGQDPNCAINEMIVPKTMTTDEALEFISACADSGVAISTVDGFHATAEGYAEDVDLMFTAAADCAPLDTAAAATQFIKDNDGPDLVWEVWSADMDVPSKP